MFASDATRNGVDQHITRIPIGGEGNYEGTKLLPQAISINFATTLKKNNVDYHLTDW